MSALRAAAWLLIGLWLTIFVTVFLAVVGWDTVAVILLCCFWLWFVCWPWRESGPPAERRRDR